MSRLWDTPEFWARTEADELLRDYPDTDAGELAHMFERTLGSYDGDPGLACGIIGELRRRASAGIRFWPDRLSLVLPDGQTGSARAGPASIEKRPGTGREGSHGLSP